MLASLRVRLVVMFMLVVMIAVGTVALVVSQSTSNNLQVYTQAKDDQQIITTVLDAYHQHESQQALQALVERLARNAHQRIILVDHQGRVLADSAHVLIGQIVTPPAVIVSSGGVSVGLQGQAPGAAAVMAPGSDLYISTDLPSPSSLGVLSTTSDSPEVTFLTAVNRSLWLAVLIAGMTALLLALAFAHSLARPLHLLTVVARRMEEGDLSQRVAIKSTGEIGALAHAFNAMADSVSRAERLRRNLVSDVAHELRNPLMNLRGTLELLQDDVLAPTPETLASLFEETSLLSRLVADLQDLSLAEAGQLRLARQAVSLQDVVHHAVQMVQPALAQKHLTLQMQVPADLPAVEADQERVAQVLRNLLTNAITHTPGAGEIAVAAERDGALVSISVRDTGAGIAPEHLPYLFERFYRADASRARATGGTGLGLAIVKQLVEAHGGRVAVASQPGAGARFTVSLPVAPNAPSA
jgi:signal transduction histidine kinase